jgi:hypothetical protein
MKLSELIKRHGDDQVKFQNLDTSGIDFKYDHKTGTKITFGTDAPLTLDGTKDMGLVVWLDREKVKQIMAEPPAPDAVHIYDPVKEMLKTADQAAYKKSGDKIVSDILQQFDAPSDSVQELAALKEKYTALVKQLDKQNGTPCENVRHAQEVRELVRLVKRSHEYRLVHDRLYKGSPAALETEATLAKYSKPGER